MSMQESVGAEQLDEWMKSLSNWGRWGAADERGTLNHLTDERRKAASELVRDGVPVGCSRLIDYGMAEDKQKPADHYMVASGDVFRQGEGPALQTAADYFGLVFHGNGVTHVDGLSHFFWDGRMYNGFESAAVSQPLGATKHSVDVASAGIVGRGVLVDVPRIRGVDYVSRQDGVRPDDIARAEQECGFEVAPGDILLIRTGQLAQRKMSGPVNPIREGCAGPDPSLLPLLHERSVSVLAGDGPNESYPAANPKYSAPIHQIGIVAMGLWLLDHVDMEDLAAHCASVGRWTFLFVIAPLRISHGTGSPVNPIALF
ncbi:cyclase family protein [Amycolatopsis acidicola]|nr:cyclase family protein [Amycolatopsis acidicola]